MIVRRVVEHALLVVLTLLAGVAFAPAFGADGSPLDLGPQPFVLAVVVGAIVPAAVVAGGRVARAHVLVTGLVALVVSVIVVLLVAGAGPSVVQGPERILTAALPAAAEPAAVGSVGLLVALASLISALLVGYGSARIRPLGVLTPLVLVALGCAVDAGARLPDTAYAVTLVVLTAVTLGVVRSSSDATSSRSRARLGWTLAGGAIVLVVSGLIVATTASRLPGVQPNPADAQHLVAPPLRARAAVAPLTQFPAFADGDDAVRLSGTSTRRLHYLPMVTLPTFTGQTWTTAARFRRASHVLASVPASSPVTVTVHASNARELAWLPRPDRPVSVDRLGLGVDRSTGDLVVPAGASYPSHYTVSGSVPTVATVALADDRALPRTAAVSSASVGVPSSVHRFAESASPAAAGYQQLLTLATTLRGGAYRLATGKSVPTGAGYAQLVDLLAGKSHTGTSEQYASLFAVAARVLGYRSRLVLGFVPHYRADGRHFTVTGQDVKTWAQVRFAGAGWVAFDPTPERGGSSSSAPLPNPAPNPSSSRQRTSTPPTHPPASSHPPVAVHRMSAGASPWWWALLLIPVLLILASPSAKTIARQRRRRRGTPAQAVLAAWQDTTAGLIEAGAPGTRGRTTGEIAAAAPGRARADVAALGGLLDRAGYAPESAGPQDAAAAWSHAAAARRALRSGMSRPRRVLAAFDPRPLFARRH